MSSSDDCRSDYKNEIGYNASDGESVDSPSPVTPSSYFHTEFTDRSGQASYGKKFRNCSVEVEIACGGNKNAGKSKVSRSTQASCSLSDQEDMPKGRKKWIRPPLVGQASSGGDVPIKQPSGYNPPSEDDAPGQHRQDYTYPNRRDYISEKPPEGGSDNRSLPVVDDKNDRPSSVSSVASGRPLEWDSGADVGYLLNDDSQHLSTLERLALVRGTAGLLARSDPEGMTVSIKKNNTPVLSSSVGLPNAESTPVMSLSKSTKSSGLISVSPIIDEAKEEPPANKPYIHLFPEVIIKNANRTDDEGQETSPRSSSRNSTKDISLLASKKLSSSLENVQDGLSDNVRASTFPRSQSQSNLETVSTSIRPHVLSRQFGRPISNSSCSVATVVNRDSTLKSSPLVQNLYSDDRPTGKESVMIDILGGGDANSASEAHSKITDITNNFNSDSLGSDRTNGGDKANSFEYLPGHVYKDIVETSNPEEHPTRSEREILMGSTNSTERDTLQKDVRRAINLLTEFVNGPKTQDKILKTNLVKKIVEKLINTKYLDDEDWSNRESLFERSDLVRKPEGKSQDLEDFGNSTSLSGSRTSVQPEIKYNRTKMDKCIGTGGLTSVSGRSVSSDWCSGSVSSRTFLSSNQSKDSEPLANSRLPTATSEAKKNRKFSKAPTIEESSGREDCRSWHEPTSLSEKHYEFRLKKEKKRSDENLIKYIKFEKKHQLEWIKSEINHLNSLKMLLEKHESLKHNVNSLKIARHKVHVSDKQVQSSLSDASNLLKHQDRRNGSSIIKNAHSQVNYQNSSLKENLRRSVSGNSERNRSRESGWSSHHYLQSDSEAEAKRRTTAEAMAAAVAEKVHNARRREINREKEKEKEIIGDRERKREKPGVDTVSDVAMQTKSFPKPVAYSINFNSHSNDDTSSGGEPNYVRRRAKTTDTRLHGEDIMVSLGELNEAISKIIGRTSGRENKRKVGREPLIEKKEVNRLIEGGDSSTDQRSVSSEPVTLQDYLATNRPGYLMRAEDRRKILAELADMRQERQRKKKQLLAAAAASGVNDHVETVQLPPPPLAVKRVVSQKNMRKQTVKKYRQLSEVRNKQSEMKQKEAYRTNRLMAEVFTKKLQAKALKGQVDLSNSISVISSV